MDTIKDLMKQNIVDLYVKVEYDGGSIKSDDDLLEVRITKEGQILKTAIKKAVIKASGFHNLKDKDLTILYGVKGSDDYIYYTLGIFNVKEVNYKVEEGVTEMVAYDRMLETMTQYNLEALSPTSLPMTMLDFVLMICDRFNFELESEDFFNNDFEINQDFFNQQKITFREILDKIAEVTASIVSFNKNGKLSIKSVNVNELEDTLNTDTLLSLKIGNSFGGVNSLVLARTPQEDNIYERDEEDVQENGLHEIRIEDNEFLDGDRENLITPLFNQLKGLKYYNLKAETVGLGYFEVGDAVKFVDKDEDEYIGIVNSIDLTLGGGIKEYLISDIPLKKSTDYKLAGTKEKRILKAELKVNKNTGEISTIANQISSIATNIDTIVGVVNLHDESLNDLQGSITQIIQDMQNIQIAVAGIGGVNLLKNSTGLKGNITEWQEFDSNGNLVNDNNTCVVVQNTEISNNTESNSALRIREEFIKQTMPVIEGETYTFYCRYKSVGNVNLVITGEDTQTLQATNDWTVYKYKFVTKTSILSIVLSNVDVEDGDAYLSDLVFKLGDCSGWIQAPNEVYGSNFKFDKDGFEVSSLTNPFKAVLDNEKLTVYDTSGGGNRIVMQVSKDSGTITKLNVNDEFILKRYNYFSNSLRMIPHESGIFFVIND